MNTKFSGGGGIKKYIIDIGANVGDTVVFMLKHTNSSFICIEPTEKFVDILKQNVKKVFHAKDRIQIVQAYVSDKKETYVSDVSSGGTAVKKKVADGEAAEAPTYTLPEIFDLCSVSSKDVSLIKSSTSGYDADALMSCGDLLKDISPMLYIETDIGSMVQDVKSRGEQFMNYWRMDDYIAAMGYRYVFVFDNFGNYLCEGNSGTLKSIHQYLLNTHLGKSNYTFDYIDFLACKQENEAKIIRQTIQQYLNVYGAVRIELSS